MTLTLCHATLVGCKIWLVGGDTLGPPPPLMALDVSTMAVSRSGDSPTILQHTNASTMAASRVRPLHADVPRKSPGWTAGHTAIAHPR